MNELTFWTELRVYLVDMFAKLFAVPHTIHVEEFPEIKLKHVELYCEDCMIVAERVFGMDETERTKFYDWLYPHRVENIENPFNLHQGAFHECCDWIGIELGDDPRLPALYEKMKQELNDGMTLTDWRYQLSS